MYPYLLSHASKLSPNITINYIIQAKFNTTCSTIPFTVVTSKMDTSKYCNKLSTSTDIAVLPIYLSICALHVKVISYRNKLFIKVLMKNKQTRKQENKPAANICT